MRALKQPQQQSRREDSEDSEERPGEPVRRLAAQVFVGRLRPNPSVVGGFERVTLGGHPPPASIATMPATTPAMATAPASVAHDACLPMPLPSSLSSRLTTASILASTPSNCALISARVGSRAVTSDIAPRHSFCCSALAAAVISALLIAFSATSIASLAARDCSAWRSTLRVSKSSSRCSRLLSLASISSRRGTSFMSNAKPQRGIHRLRQVEIHRENEWPTELSRPDSGCPAPALRPSIVRVAVITVV